MDLNHVLIIDSFLTSRECNKIIKINSSVKFSKEVPVAGYEDRIVDILSKELKFLPKKLQKAISKYSKKYPEINFIASLDLVDCRIKRFRPGKHFAHWHADHSPYTTKRILGVMIYLTDHKSGTEFFNGNVVRSKAGRIIIWPSSFTHMHRGQKCPNNKERYIFSAYFEYSPRIHPENVGYTREA